MNLGKQFGKQNKTMGCPLQIEALNRILSRNLKLLRCKNFHLVHIKPYITPRNMVRLFASNECYIHVEQLILTRVETP
jgi:hypothetical protein